MRNRLEPQDLFQRGAVFAVDRHTAVTPPVGIDTEVAIIEQEASEPAAEGLEVTVPAFMTDIVANVSHVARASSHISQRSGVSVRLSIANHEVMVANATRRTIRSGGTHVVPRVVDRMIGVPDAASVATMLFLDDRFGLRAGPSTGTNLYGALMLACELRAAGRTGSIVFIPIGNCGIGVSETSTWPFGGTYLMAHELTHLLGAVPFCAPNADGTGHVSDDNRDVLYSGPEARDWDNLMLDPGNDDYYNHGQDGCTDIADSPLLGTY